MVNKVILVGRLGHSPSGRFVNETPVVNFSLATSEKWTDKSGTKQERTEWHKVVVWGKLAQLCEQYLEKGSLVYVDGKLETRQWEDKEGNKRYTTQVIASTVRFLSTKQSSSSLSGGKDFVDSDSWEPGSVEGDLPF